MSPADVDGVVRGFLIRLGRHHREPVVGHIAERTPRLGWQDEGVELAVGLQRAAAVDAGDVPVRQEQGAGGGDVPVVQAHRPVAHHHPAPERIALVQKIIVFHAVVGVEML